MADTPRRFGIRLRAWRKAQGQSLRLLARQAQASEAYVTQIENGLRTPPDPESAIGKHLYSIVDDSPDPQERWLWATWSAMQRTYLYLAWEILVAYEVGRTLTEGDESPGVFEDSNVVNPLELPDTVSADDILTELGGWASPRTRLLAGIMGCSDGVVVDWLIQTTKEVRFDFDHRFMESADRIRVNAKLRYPVAKHEWVRYVWPD